MTKRLLISFLIFLLSALFSFESATELVHVKDSNPENLLLRFDLLSKEMTLSFSGDIMAHDINFNMKDYSKIYEDVKGFLLIDELSFCNIEMPVADQLPLSTYPAFNVHSDYVGAAINAGFDVFSFANNHTNDHQVKGIKGTIASFNKLQKEFKEKKRFLYSSGVKEDKNQDLKPTLIEKNGFKILFLAVTELLNSYDNSKDHVYYLPSSADGNHLLAEKIKRMREEIPCDLFILSLHVNEPEYKREVLEEKRKRFYLLAKAGADIIWANHPHVVQEWEIVTVECEVTDGSKKYHVSEDENKTNKNDKPIKDIKTSKFYKKAFFMYSLGNFISGQRRNLNYKNPNHYWEYTGDSVLMQLKFPANSLSLENMKVSPIFITTYKGKDGIVVKQLKSDWISSLPKADKDYYKVRLELMQSYLP